MNTRKILLAIFLALFLTTILSAGSAMAGPTPVRRKAVFQYVKTQNLFPGKAWMDRDGLHIRGRVDEGVVSGTISGTAHVVYNADIKFGTGLSDDFPMPSAGASYGTIEIFSQDQDSVLPMWSGDWAYKISSNKVYAGQLVATSPGGQLLLNIFSVHEGENGVLYHTGYIERTRLEIELMK